MNRSFVVVTMGLAMVIGLGAAVLAGPPPCAIQPCPPPVCAVPAAAPPMCGPPCLYVATVKNFRGAMYLGNGPTPGHAAECAMAKCTQDSFISASCKVVCMRAEALPAPPPVMMKQTSKYRAPKKAAAAAQPMGNAYSWGRPMP
jgi:hypothetical protein